MIFFTYNEKFLFLYSLVAVSVKHVECNFKASVWFYKKTNYFKQNFLFLIKKKKTHSLVLTVETDTQCKRWFLKNKIIILKIKQNSSTQTKKKKTNLCPGVSETSYYCFASNSTLNCAYCRLPFYSTLFWSDVHLKQTKKKQYFINQF